MIKIKDSSTLYYSDSKIDVCFYNYKFTYTCVFNHLKEILYKSRLNKMRYINVSKYYLMNYRD